MRIQNEFSVTSSDPFDESFNFQVLLSLLTYNLLNEKCRLFVLEVSYLKVDDCGTVVNFNTFFLIPLSFCKLRFRAGIA